MKCAIVIPARYHSTRLPHKLMLDDTGKELICHTVDMAVLASRLEPTLFGRVFVATDHEDIMFVVNGYAHHNHLPVEAVLTREDHPSGSDRVAEVVIKHQDEMDVVINLQGDEPEMDPRAVAELAVMMAENEKTDIATLAYPLNMEDAEDPNLVKVVTGREGNALYFSRSLIPYDRDKIGAPGLYNGHVGIYAYRKEALLDFVELPQGRLEKVEKLEQLRALENDMRIKVKLLEKRPPKGVDTKDDYLAFVERMKNNNPDML